MNKSVHQKSNHYNNYYTSKRGLAEVETKIDSLLSLPDMPQQNNFTSSHSSGSSYNRQSNQFNRQSNQSNCQSNQYNRQSNQYNRQFNQFSHQPREGNYERDPILNEILDAVHSLQQNYKGLEDKLGEALHIIKTQETEIKNLKGQNEQLNSRLDDVTQNNRALNYEVNMLTTELRGTSLILSGDKLQIENEFAPSSLISRVRDTCLNEVEYEIPKGCISNCKKLVSKNGKNSVLMTFSDMSVREQIFSKILQLKEDGLYANEYLSKHNDQLLYELRKLKRESNKDFKVFSRGGIPCYRFPGQNESVHRVFNPGDLEKLQKRVTTRNLRPRNNK